MAHSVSHPAAFSGMLLPAPERETMAQHVQDREPADARRMAWMRAAQDGDAAAYAALLRDCVPLIVSAARRQGVQGDRVQDVVQDVLLTIHRVRHTYDPERSFNAWLRAIAGRRAIDSLRRHGRHGARELHVPGAYDAHADPAHGADETLSRDGRAERLTAAVARLPAGQRQAVELLGLREQTLAEASAATGRSTGALKVNLHRALKTLRAMLGGPL